MWQKSKLITHKHAHTHTCWCVFFFNSIKRLVFVNLCPRSPLFALIVQKCQAIASRGSSVLRIRRSILHPFCRSNGERPRNRHSQPYSERVSPVVFTAPEGHSTRWAIRAFLSAANETRPSPVLYIRAAFHPVGAPSCFSQTVPDSSTSGLRVRRRGNLIYCPRTAKRFFLIGPENTANFSFTVVIGTSCSCFQSGCTLFVCLQALRRTLYTTNRDR